MEPELRDVAPGLWIWRLAHPDWTADADWDPPVTSTCVESGGEVVLIDPLAPPDDAAAIWERLDAQPPTVVVVLKPDHVRDVDHFVERYAARAFGPYLFWRHDIPQTELEGIQPGDELPGGLLALYDGRGRAENARLAPGAAHARLRGRPDRAGGRAAGLGDAVARAAHAAGLARAARASVRARDRLARRAGARPRRIRARARAAPVRLGGLGGMVLAVGVRWSFRGKDAGSVRSE